jgi:hypothetical protein
LRSDRRDLSRAGHRNRTGAAGVIRHSCWRAVELFRSRDRCRYTDRMTDAQCEGCACRKPDPRPRATWLDRSRQFANEGKQKWDL